MRIRHITDAKPGSLKSEADKFCRHTDLVEEDMATDWLKGMGMTCDEMRILDLRQPLLQEVLEYAGLRPGRLATPDDLLKALEAAEKVIGDHVRDLEQQIWMLRFRKDSLERKTLAIRRMLRVLKPAGRLRVA